ncbi:MAG: signal recognition particle-docking protein FtsY [Methylococcaceae bacterium]|nr:signal recognition particle-docking protein FtsY [Methylococcaceae bacterium]
MFRKINLLACVLAFISVVFNAYLHLSKVGFKVAGIENFLSQPQEMFNNWMLPYVWCLLVVNVLVLAALSWRQQQYRCAAITTTLTVTVLLGLQAVVGIWAIKLLMMPIVATAEQLLGFISFWLLFRLYLRSNPELVLQGKIAGIRYFAHAGILLLFVQVLFGLWTNANTAGLVCSDFPRCNGQWLPQADFISAISIFNGLINNYVGVLSFDAQIAAHWLHRVGGLTAFIVFVFLMLSATSETRRKPVRKAGLFLSILLLIETSLGAFSIKYGLPLWMMTAHAAFAALLMLPLIAISFYSKYGFAGAAEATLEELELEHLHETIDRLPPDVSEEVAEPVKVEIKPESTDSVYLRLKSQLKKTRGGLGGILNSLPLGQKGLSEELLEEIEAQLLLADIGIDATTEIIAKLTDSLDKHQLKDSATLLAALKQDLLDILKPCDQALVIPKQDTPFVILVVGVNGAGKTTTIGKLAKKLQNQGHSVMLAAGDTFRAAAVEQLQAWGERNEVHVVAQHTGADSASVIFDGVQSAKAKGIDVLIADTAGRLHTKSNLMEELKKIKRIMGKLDETAPHEVLLVLDAGTGQNALSQARLFNEAVALTGLTLTKLDGTAKGGVIFALAKQLPIPIRHIGIGEGIDDLQDFNAEHFVNALFVTDE